MPDELAAKLHDAMLAVLHGASRVDGECGTIRYSVYRVGTVLRADVKGVLELRP